MWKKILIGALLLSFLVVLLFIIQPKINNDNEYEYKIVFRTIQLDVSQLHSIIKRNNFTRSDYAVNGIEIYTNNLSLAILLNNYRAFLNFIGVGTPISLLIVSDDKSLGFFVSTDPYNYYSDYSYDNYIMHVKDIKQIKFYDKLVDQEKMQKYFMLNRKSLMNIYFRNRGILKDEYLELMFDINFVCALILSGYFVYLDLDSAWLRIE